MIASINYTRTVSAATTHLSGGADEWQMLALSTMLACRECRDSTAASVASTICTRVPLVLLWCADAASSELSGERAASDNSSTDDQDDSSEDDEQEEPEQSGEL